MVDFMSEQTHQFGQKIEFYFPSNEVNDFGHKFLLVSKQFLLSINPINYTFELLLLVFVFHFEKIPF